MVMGVDILGPDDMAHELIHESSNLCQIADDFLLTVRRVLEEKLPRSLAVNLQRFT